MKRQHTEFENIVVLIQEARNRAFSKVNAELVLLYYSVGKIVSEKVAAGIWGEGTVDQLAKYIAAKLPGLSGFNRRGLYRMKQFFETYSIQQFVSPMATHLRSYLTNNSAPSKMSETTVQLFQRNIKSKKGSPTLSQADDIELLHQQFVTTMLTQIQWSAHLHILNKTKTPEEKLFYILLSIKEKLLVREIERQLNTAVYERSMLGKQFLGKLNFYLEALDRDVKRPFENNSVGVLLCKGKDNEVVEYAMARNTSPAMIADYETKLIPKNVLANKLHQLVKQLSKKGDK